MGAAAGRQPNAPVPITATALQYAESPSYVSVMT